MPRMVRARLDDGAQDDLALLRNEVESDAAAIRLALRESAERRRRRSAVREEALRAAADTADLAEARRVRAAMDAASLLR